MERLYKTGLTQLEIARQYGVSQKMVFGWFRKLGIKSRVAAKRNQWGELNHMWKGNDASYAAFHYRLDHKFGRPKKCSKCETTDETRIYDWANLTGRYEDIQDYKRMCRQCHRAYDKARRERDVTDATLKA